MLQSLKEYKAIEWGAVMRLLLLIGFSVSGTKKDPEPSDEIFRSEALCQPEIIPG